MKQDYLQNLCNLQAVLVPENKFEPVLQAPLSSAVTARDKLLIDKEKNEAKIIFLTILNILHTSS